MEPHDSEAWRRLVTLPLRLVLVCVLVLNVAGWAIDASALDQGEDSWGFTFGAVFLTLYAVPLLVVVLACAAAGRPTSSGVLQAAFAWTASAASGGAGIALGALVLPPLADSPADTVFGLVALALAAVLLVPAALCARQVLRQRASAAAS